MEVSFNDLKQNYLLIKTEILKEVNEVFDRAEYILGPKVAAFEKEFADFHKVSFCHGTSSGTDANHLALWALGIGPGDEVIMPVNTFIATAWGATLCGATPVFVDCEADSYNIDPDLIESKINSKTKGIVAVHLYGQPADMDRIKSIAQKHNLYVIEDAAQAHDAEYKGQKVGGLGDVASFSFYPGKNLGTYGEGGAVTTNNAALAHKMKILREHGCEEKYNHIMLGHNYRMEAIQGAVLGVKIKYLKVWTEKRRAVASIYSELLHNIEEIKLPVEKSFNRHVYHLYVIQAKERENLQNFLKQKGIATGLHYPIPLHLQSCFIGLGYKKGDYPNSEALADNCLSLPIFPEMTEEEVMYVADNIRAFYHAPTLS